MKVLQCGDLFIQADRFEEYCEVFDNFCEKIDKYKPDIIVITGNLIKDLTSANDTKLAVAFLTEIASLAKTLIYFEGFDVKIPNVTYLTKGVHVLFGIAWMVDTMYCDESFFKIAICKKIAKSMPKANIVMASGKNRREPFYAGALVQQSILDGASNYGFLLWDTDKVTSEFIEVNNDRGYLRFKIASGVMSGIHSKKPNFWDIHTDENSDYFKAQLAALIKLYGKPKNIIINDNVNPLNIVDFIKNALIDKLDTFDEILAIHNSYGFAGQRSVITLKEMYFDNLYCYGPDNYVDFREYNNGLTGIFGDNEMGKSALINIIKAGFYGGKGEIVNAGNKTGRVKLIYDKDDKTITRDVIIDATKDANNSLIFDISAEVLDITSIINQTDNDILSSGNIKDLLAKTLNIDLKQKCKSDLAKLASKLKGLKRHVNVENKVRLTNTLESVNKKLNNLTPIDIGAEKRRLKLNNSLLEKFPDINECHEKYKTKFDLKKAFEIKKFADSVNISEVTAAMKKAKKEYEERLDLCDKCDSKQFELCEGFRDIKEFLDDECTKIKKEFLENLAILKKYKEYDCDNIDKEIYWHRCAIEADNAKIRQNLQFDNGSKLRFEKATILKKLSLLDENIEKVKLENECRKSYNMLKLYCDTIDDANQSIIGSQLEKITDIANGILKIGGKSAGEIRFDTSDNYKIYYKDDKSDFFHSASLTSGYRRFSISLALRLAIWQLSQGTVLNALIIDEKISSCDISNMKLIMDFLENITTLPNMPKLNIIISHIEYVKCRMVNRIEIKAGPNGSYIGDAVAKAIKLSEYYCPSCKVTIKNKKIHCKTAKHSGNVKEPGGL